ncbi:MAG: CRISPR-associated endonuclease Cas2 [Opitutales bacterium]
MYLLVAYDVSTTSPEGQRRLRQVARACQDYGQRVQQSVFECKLTPADYVVLKQRLLKILDPRTDSIRFYNLGNRWQQRVEHFGKNDDYNIDGLLLVE